MGPESTRVTALVDHAPIGLTATNRGHFMHGFYQWAEELPEGTFALPAGMDPIAAASARTSSGSDFVFSVPRSFVESMQTPTLVLPGRDLAHPEAIGLESAQLAPNADLKMGWQDDLDEAGEAVRSFLAAQYVTRVCQAPTPTGTSSAIRVSRTIASTAAVSSAFSGSSGSDTVRGE